MNRALVGGLRAQGTDVLTALEAGTSGWTDEEQLEFAAQEGRVLVTFNQGDFYDLHTRYLTEGRTHAGIILALQQRYAVGEYLRRLLRLVLPRPSDEMRDQVEFLKCLGPNEGGFDLTMFGDDGVYADVRNALDGRKSVRDPAPGFSPRRPGSGARLGVALGRRSQPGLAVPPGLS